MSIRVENNLINQKGTEIFNQRAHYIPCKIEEDGPANVKQYFETYIKETNDNKGYKGTFRGHPLEGVEIELPSGYSGIIATETKRPLSEDADRKLQVVGGFNKIIYWNWDKEPTKNDQLVKAMDWIDIAQASLNTQLQEYGPYRTLVLEI